MYSIQHIASFPGHLSDQDAIGLLTKMKKEEGLVPFHIHLNISEEVLIVSDEKTKEIIEAYRMKKVQKCRAVHTGQEIGSLVLLTTSKLKSKNPATHIFRANAELAHVIVGDINNKQKISRKKTPFGKRSEKEQKKQTH